jgi:uncharacterized protein (DUF305 family)
MRVGKSLVAVGLATALVAGCGGSKPAPEEEPSQSVSVVQPGAPGEPTKKVDPNATPAAIQHTQADVEFMQGMIHHHQQALTMTDWVPERTRSTSVRLMARRMGLSQQAEIDQMWKWLEARGVDPTDHSHRHTTMPGMLTSRQLERLKTADGARFDALFLRYMTQHHRGALTMVGELQAKGGGAEAEINAFTRHVDADQASEILRMQRLLTGL